MINYGSSPRKDPNIIPNGALIGGVANFFTNTKPTTRVDGSALVIGDLWVNPSTGVEGFWNGTYWLDKCHSIISSFTPPNFANTGGIYFTLPSSAFFIEQVVLGAFYTNGNQPNWSGSNSFVLNFLGGNGVAIVSPVTVNSLVNVTQQSTTHYAYRQIVALSAAFFSLPSNTFFQILGTGRVGSPTPTNSTASILLHGRDIL
jgi:hypothetical protein